MKTENTECIYVHIAVYGSMNGTILCNWPSQRCRCTRMQVSKPVGKNESSNKNTMKKFIQ